LLRIAQIESGMPTRHFAKVDLSDLLRTVSEVYQPMAEERDQRFRAEIASGLTVWGDRELLTQMVANVIENAMKHSPAGAHVDLVTAELLDTVTVAVSDSGPGIPIAEHRRVFRRFYRLESSRSTPGNGLGLSLVEAIAALHQVSIELSDADPGLRFTLRFLRLKDNSLPEINSQLARQNRDRRSVTVFPPPVEEPYALQAQDMERT
jgi:signal transduction histidine kinase